ncbi:MAG TPA: hypothetical protein VF048_09915 [Gemmatimonadaceae bacterium]|jgi:hypothetical protein
MDSMIAGFDFVDGGRTYTCRAAAQCRGQADAWWWFVVAGDRNRYAPFRVTSNDTEASVRARIVEYYEGRMAPRVWTSWRDRRGSATQG